MRIKINLWCYAIILDQPLNSSSISTSLSFELMIWNIINARERTGWMLHLNHYTVLLEVVGGYGHLTLKHEGFPVDQLSQEVHLQGSPHHTTAPGWASKTTESIQYHKRQELGHRWTISYDNRTHLSISWGTLKFCIYAWLTITTYLFTSITP